mgnify:CR=1 FL=1
MPNWLEERKFDGFGDYDRKFVASLAENGFRSLKLPIDLDLYILNREACFGGETELRNWDKRSSHP